MPTLTDLHTKYLDTLTGSHLTYTQYRLNWGTVELWAAHTKRKLDPLYWSPDLVEDFFAWGQKTRGWTAKTKAARVSHLRSFSDWLVRNGHVVRNPLAGMRVKIPERLPDYHGREAVLEVFTAATEPRTHAILACLYYAGLRNAEARNLLVADVDLQAMRVKVRNGKGSKDGYIPIVRPLADAVKAWLPLRGQETDRLFPGLDHSAMHRIFKAFPMLSDGSRLTPHSLRHAFATHLLEAGVDLMTVKELMRHSSLATTQRYLTITDQRKVEGVNRLDGLEPRKRPDVGDNSEIIED